MFFCVCMSAIFTNFPCFFALFLHNIAQKKLQHAFAGTCANNCLRGEWSQPLTDIWAFFCNFLAIRTTWKRIHSFSLCRGAAYFIER